jgi:hypothetical protein
MLELYRISLDHQDALMLSASSAETSKFMLE